MPVVVARQRSLAAGQSRAGMAPFLPPPGVGRIARADGLGQSLETRLQSLNRTFVPSEGHATWPVFAPRPGGSCGSLRFSAILSNSLTAAPGGRVRYGSTARVVRRRSHRDWRWGAGRVAVASMPALVAGALQFAAGVVSDLLTGSACWFSSTRRWSRHCQPDGADLRNGR